MIITIDTNKDTHTEIGKAIQMLRSLVGEKEVINSNANIFEDNSDSGVGGGLFGLFDSPSESTTTEASPMMGMFDSPAIENVSEPVVTPMTEEKASIQFY